MIKFKARTTNGEIINSAVREFIFPAGETHVKREERRELEETEIAILYADENLHKDLFLLQMWSDYITRNDSSVRQVAVIPYFPGARSDKPKSEDPFGAAIYASVFAVNDIDEVIIFDPHSEIIVDELKKIPALTVTVWNPADLFATPAFKDVIDHQEYVGVIAPDKGAFNRASEVAEQLGVPVFTAEKVRDQKTGKILHFAMLETPPNEGSLLVVDDICDGGGTFAAIAGILKNRSGDLDIYISHGVFSGKALETLSNTYDHIYTTNSYNPTRFLGVTTYGGQIVNNSDRKFSRIDVIHMMLDWVRV